MADTKLSALTTASSIANSDKMLATISGNSRGITWENVQNSIRAASGSVAGTMSSAHYSAVAALPGTILSNVVEDTTPQLGGGLDVNGQSIISVANGNILITPHGTGQVRPGEVNCQDSKIIRPYFQDYAEVRPTPSSSAGTLTLDLTTGNVFEVTLTENVTTLTISNWPATGRAGSFTLVIHQDGTGGWTVTWPAAVLWHNGSAPTVSAAIGATDIYSFLSTTAGTTIYGGVGGQAFA